MVYRRRVYARRRRSYRKRPMFKRRRIGFRPRRSRGKVMSFTRSTNTFKLDVRDQIDYHSATFSLNDIPNRLEFQNLFDQYRINAVVLEWTYTAQPPTTPSGEYVTPMLHWCIDNNDATLPVSLTEMGEYKTYRHRPLVAGRPIRMKVYPKPLQMLYQSAVSTAYGPKKMWINSSDFGVPHYGVKWAIEGNQAAGTGENIMGVLTIQTKYYIQCKQYK